MTVFQYAVARCYNQFHKTGEMRALTLQELNLVWRLKRDAERFEAEENKPIEVSSGMSRRRKRSQTVIPRFNRKVVGARI